MLTLQHFAGVEVVGIVATINEPFGLDAQCGWFAMDRIDWFWARITDIQAVRAVDDKRFRGGERTVTLRSRITDYLLLNPHDNHRDLWHPTLLALGVPVCEPWPSNKGPHPSWWPNQWISWWPLNQPVAGSKRRASSDEDELQALTQGLSVEPTQLGNSPEARREAEVILTHIDHMEPWALGLDLGVQPTAVLGGQESAQGPVRNQSEKAGGRKAKRARR
ncbi:hypothetical protein RSOL_284520, partial [Rhizoctonia solani AG-3 Rhs1AP]